MQPRRRSGKCLRITWLPGHVADVMRVSLTTLLNSVMLGGVESMDLH